MTDWERLWNIFHEASSRDPDKRSSFLEEACGSDAALRREIEELLEAEGEAEKILRTRAFRADTALDGVEDLIPDEFAPRTLLSNRFEIVQLLGRGGMGTVYKAMDRQLSRPVALKFLHTDDLRFTRRFQLEARFQARIDHVNICKIYEVGEAENRHFISMQFISGKTLQDAAPEMTLSQKVILMRQVCAAVHAAHELGVIHRDLKPANILVTRSAAGDWTPYVTDFGLARELAAPGMTNTGMVMGTASYMAPEQARGEIRKLDRRCDVHALGATLYELLCGRPPFEGRSSVEVLAKVMNEDPPPLRQRNASAPPELEIIVHKCLEKDPDRRYDTASALAADLGRYLEDEPILARPVTRRYRAARKMRKYPVVTGLLAASVVAVCALSAFAGWTWWRAQAQARIANEFEQEIRFMEDTARHAYTQPAHNILAEEAIVGQRLDAIQKRIADAGSVAEGPGHFAMGRGYMALYKFPEAREHLARAWKEYPIPRVAFALGVTLALLYEKELERADRIPDKQAREEKKKAIESEFKNPALHYIAEGRTAIEAAEYVEGLIAFLEKRYDTALQKARIAFDRQPWLYEAKKLEADTLRALGNERRNTGDTKGAIEFYEKAEAAYRETVREGASYWLGYGSLCALGHDWTSMMMYQTGFPDEVVLKKSVDACNSSLQINPDRPEAYIAKSALKGAWGSYEMGRGLDPTKSFNESIEAARAALKWEWVRFAVYTNMGVAYSRRASYEMEHGKDATEALQQSIECSRQAVQLSPNSAPFRNNLGIALAIKADYDIRNGRDAGALRDEAIREFKEAVRIQPDFESAHNSLGEIHLEKAQSEYDRGNDPDPLCEVSIAYLRKAIEVNATFIPAYTNLGNVYKLQSRYKLDRNLDPTSEVEPAVRNYEKTLELNPKDADALIQLAGVYRIQGEYDSMQKRDPSTSLKKASEALIKAEEFAGGHPDLPVIKAEVALTSALWKADHGSDREASLEVLRGLDHMNQALLTNPKNAESHSAKGSLLLLQARLAKSLPARRKAAREAESAFHEAVRLNPRVSSRYEASIAEAHRLAAS